MNNAIKDNEDLIKSRVYSLISNYDFDEVKDEIYTVLCESLQRQLFGNREQYIERSKRFVRTINHDLL